MRTPILMISVAAVLGSVALSENGVGAQAGRHLSGC
jgi:hypothetical protein